MMSGLARVIRDEKALAATRQLLAILPKMDLHTHVAGNVPEWLFAESARRYGIGVDDPEHPYDYVEGMQEFLVIFQKVTDTFRTQDDLHRAVYESQMADARASNLRYREMHYSPTVNEHLSYADAIAAIAAGIEQAKLDHGVDGRIIIAIYRDQGPEVAERMVAEMAANPHPAVVGLGIEADEELAPLPLFKRAYSMARDAGFQLTAHVGERANLAEVLYAVDELEVDRIDHAYVLATDPAATAHVRDLGLHIASTWVSAIAHHQRGFGNPLRTMLDAGLPASISSDDPGITRVLLNDALFAAAVELELPDSYLIDQNYAQADAAWIDDATRSAIRAEIDAALSSLAPTK
jgi:adenosine deaminase